MCLFNKIYELAKYANSLNKLWYAPIIELTNPQKLIRFIHSPCILMRKKNDDWIDINSFGLCQYSGEYHQIVEFLFRLNFHEDELFEIAWSCPNFYEVGMQRYDCLSKEVIELFNIELPKYFNKEQLLNYINDVILENII